MAFIQGDSLKSVCRFMKVAGIRTHGDSVPSTPEWKENEPPQTIRADGLARVLLPFIKGDVLLQSTNERSPPARPAAPLYTL